MTRVSETTMQRKLNHVLEIELNFVGCQRIGESVERLLQLCFEVFQRAQHFVNGCLVQQTLRSIDKETNVFVKFYFRWKLGVVHFEDPPSCHCVALRSLA